MPQDNYPPGMTPRDYAHVHGAGWDADDDEIEEEPEDFDEEDEEIPNSDRSWIDFHSVGR